MDSGAKAGPASARALIAGFAVAAALAGAGCSEKDEPDVHPPTVPTPTVTTPGSATAPGTTATQPAPETPPPTAPSAPQP